MSMVQRSGLQSVRAKVGVVHKQLFELRCEGADNEQYERATKRTRLMNPGRVFYRKSGTFVHFHTKS
jgi:hypothetical protein